MTEDARRRAAWRGGLPVLAGRSATLREAEAGDVGPLVDLLCLADATRFGIDEEEDEGVSPAAVEAFIARSVREREAGSSLTYVITLASSRAVVGLIRVRELDPAFEVGEWECTIAPSSRGSGLFLEAARLVASFVFGAIGMRRLEARVPIQNGRSNGALRKLGAVQEGVLRRSLRRNDKYFDQVLWSMLRDDWVDRADHPFPTNTPRVH